MYLRELRQPVSELKGVGKSTFAAYTALGVKTWCDLLLHLPRAYEDRRVTVHLNKGYNGNPVNTIVEVISHTYIGRGRNKTLKVVIADETALKRKDDLTDNQNDKSKNKQNPLNSSNDSKIIIDNDNLSPIEQALVDTFGAKQIKVIDQNK